MGTIPNDDYEEEEEIDIMGDGNARPNILQPTTRPTFMIIEPTESVVTTEALHGCDRSDDPSGEGDAHGPGPTETDINKPISNGQHASKIRLLTEPLEPQPPRRRGHPPGASKKTLAAQSAPQTRPPPPPTTADSASEPLTKRAKIQAELQQGHQPAPVSRSSFASFAATAAGPKPATSQPVRRPIMLETRREAPKYLPMSPSSLGKDSSSPGAALLHRPSHRVLPTQQQPGTAGSQPAPGEAYKSWLEENKHSQEQQNEALIEELPEMAPRHQPSAQELAADAACREFSALLPGLNPGREAIGQATAAALRAAAAGASARAVRIVLDAAAEAPGPKERLPYLYVLDSAIKVEFRHAQATKQLQGSQDENTMVSFPRAVGAGLVRLGELMSGDEEVRPKVAKLLGIWRREGLVAEKLIGPVLDSLENEAIQAAAATARSQEGDLMALLRATPLNAVVSLTYTMPNGESKVVGPPPPTPSDWSTPASLGLTIPPSTVRRTPLVVSSPPLRIDDRHMGPPEYPRPPTVSPWRRQWLGLEPERTSISPTPSFQPRYPALPPPFITANGAPLPSDDLDEFDQGLLRDAVGAGVGDGSAPGTGGMNRSASGARLSSMQRARSSSVPSNMRLEEGELAPWSTGKEIMVEPPPLPPRSPLRDEYSSWGPGGPNGNANADINGGGGAGGLPMDLQQQQQQQQQMLMAQQAAQQMAQQQMLMMNQLAMAGGLGMNAMNPMASAMGMGLGMMDPMRMMGYHGGGDPMNHQMSQQQQLEMNYGMPPGMNLHQHGGQGRGFGPAGGGMMGRGGGGGIGGGRMPPPHRSQQQGPGWQGSGPGSAGGGGFRDRDKPMGRQGGYGGRGPPRGRDRDDRGRDDRYRGRDERRDDRGRDRDDRGRDDRGRDDYRGRDDRGRDDRGRDRDDYRRDDRGREDRGRDDRGRDVKRH